MVYIIQVCRQKDQDGITVPSWSCSTAAYKSVWYIPLLSVQWINSWWWTDELSETCRVSCQNKFVKLVHLVGFIIKKFWQLFWGDCGMCRDKCNYDVVVRPWCVYAMKFKLGRISEVVFRLKCLARSSTIKDTKTEKRLPSRIKRIKKKDPIELNVLQLMLKPAEIQN